MSKAAGMENLNKDEKQLSWNLTLSDIFKKHIRSDKTPVPSSVSSPKKVSTEKKIISAPSAQAQTIAEARSDPIESSQCAQIALEGALARWKEAIEWREANKDVLAEKARAFYKSI